jgi:phosphoenolpyruvate carboxylase
MKTTADYIAAGFEKIDADLKFLTRCLREVLSLKKAGMSDSDILNRLSKIRVEPVLTAHPTEAKRPAVIEQHRALFARLTDLESDLLTPSEREQKRAAIKVALERLWRSGEILLEKPEVSTERRGVLHYLMEVFPPALEYLDTRLREAWSQCGFQDPLPEDPACWPKLRFGKLLGGSWCEPHGL